MARWKIENRSITVIVPPADVISSAVRWYFHFQSNPRTFDELIFERGVVETYETIPCQCDKLDKAFFSSVKAVRRKPYSTWHLDDMFVTRRGEPHLLWRAVDVVRR
jgi:putative transposase